MELALANQKKVAHLLALLTPAQTERLRQINRQTRVPEAFRDEDVDRALDLAPDQREKILFILASYRFQTHPHHFGGHDLAMRNADSEQARKNREEARKTATANILQLLTEEQRSRWAQLIGKPFTASVRMGPWRMDACGPKPRFDRPGNNCPPNGGAPVR